MAIGLGALCAVVVLVFVVKNLVQWWRRVHPEKKYMRTLKPSEGQTSTATTAATTAATPKQGRARVQPERGATPDLEAAGKRKRVQPDRGATPDATASRKRVLPDEEAAVAKEPDETTVVEAFSPE